MFKRSEPRKPKMISSFHWWSLKLNLNFCAVEKKTFPKWTFVLTMFEKKMSNKRFFLSKTDEKAKDSIEDIFLEEHIFSANRMSIISLQNQFKSNIKTNLSSPSLSIRIKQSQKHFSQFHPLHSTINTKLN